MTKLSLIVAGQLLFLGVSAQTLESEGERFRHRADSFRSDFDTKVTVMEGNVVVESNERKLEADRMEIYGKSGRIVSSGNVRYTQGPLSASGERADLNMRSGLGYFENSIIRIGESLYLEGRKIERYEDERFRVTHGKVSTCQDCPQSWSIMGAEINVRIEGYAEVHHALIQIKDTPVAYIPILVFPVKTKRQSGVLPPQFRYERELGLQMGVPYFWAISDDADATFEYRPMTKGGHRLFNEIRYTYSSRTYIDGGYSLLRNDEVLDVPDARWGTSFSQRAQIGKYFVQRYSGEWLSDQKYSRHFEREFAQSRLSNTTQEFSFAHQHDNYFVVARSMFNDDNIPRQFNYDFPDSGIEHRSVHSLPDVEAWLPSYRLLHPLRFEARSRYLSLRRFEQGGSGKASGGIDPETNFIRTGDRATMEATLKAPTSLGAFVYRPLVQARFDSYQFPDEVAKRSSWRLRSFFEQEASTDVWRVYRLEEAGNLKAIKHSIIPKLRWTYSPRDAMDIHPFYYQKDSYDRGSPKFDLFDPNSDVGSARVGTLSEEQRLTHHHFITAGLGTRIIARYGEEARRYEEHFGANVTQDYNFLSKDLGRMHVTAFGAYAPWRLSTDMSIDVTKNWNADVTNRLEYNTERYSANFFQRIITGAPSVGGGGRLNNLFSFSFGAEVAYDLRLNRWQEQIYSVLYRSPSKCWIFEFIVGKGPGSEGWDFDPIFRPEFYSFNVQYIPGA